MSKLDNMVGQEMDEWERINRLEKLEKRNRRIAKEKECKHRNFILGELVSKYFHDDVAHLPPGTKAENAVVFAEFQTFLSIIAANKELTARLKQEARIRLTQHDP